MQRCYAVILSRFARHLGAHRKTWPARLWGVSTPSEFGTLKTWSLWQGYGDGRFFCTLVHQKERLSKQEEALQATLAEISKTFGVEAVMWLGRASTAKAIPVIQTGSLTLDNALGIGGLPKGRIIEIFGPEGSGKTMLALHIIAEAQKIGGDCVFIDVNRSDFAHAEAFGVNMGSLLVAQPDNWEEALTLLDQFVQRKTVDVIVVDTLAALFPKTEDKGKVNLGLQARILSQTLRKLMHAISANKTLLIFITQTSSKLSAPFYEVQKESLSGNVLKSYSSVRLSVQKTEYLEMRVTLVKVVKNKLAPPFKTAEFEMEVGRGISKEGEVLDQAVKYGVVVKSGSLFLYNGAKIGDGRANAKAFLGENAELQETFTMRIKERLAKGSKEL